MQTAQHIEYRDSDGRVVATTTGPSSVPRAGETVCIDGFLRLFVVRSILWQIGFEPGLTVVVKLDAS